MLLKTVGILSPGDMGHTVGQVLGAHGLRVITCLQGRSERTRLLAKQANITDVLTYRELVCEADLILSILVPAQAMQAAQKVAQAIAEVQTPGKANVKPLYADCNAISPQTACQIGEIIIKAGGRFVDASIIGPPPEKKGLTRFYASGPDMDTFAKLAQFGLDVYPLGDQTGQASAIKMCYAALTKGLTALGTELLIAADALGVSQALKEEFKLSQSALYERLERQLPTMPMKSRRWIGEMEEVAATFEQIGLPPKILAGAAEMYRFVGDTRLADRIPEDRDPLPSLSEMISILRGYLPGRS
jgi:3-hydroxyisobutyrate dehydrogenase-like beta-hydroxyacid dehydrogenase